MALDEKHSFPSFRVGHDHPAPKGTVRGWMKRLSWFAGIWAASVLTLAAIAYLLRAWIGS